MKRTIIPSLLFVVFCVLPSMRADADAGPPATDGADLLLVAGEQQIIEADDIASFSESTAGVIEVKVPRSGRQLVVTALRPGDTSLLLLRHDGTSRHIAITVFARHPAAIIEELRTLVAIPGITYLRMGPRVFIDGEVRTEAELARIEKVKALYPGQVQSLVQVGNPVRARTNIRLDLTFIELSAAKTMEAGVRWPAELGAGGAVEMSYDLMTGMPAASFRVVDQAAPSLAAAEASGAVRIRKKAYLVTTSGSPASYHAGGEVNVKVAGSQAAELRTVPWGCSLKVLPRLDREAGVIDLEVEAEVADLKETDQDAPGRTISKVQTLVHLGLGQSIVLSGLDARSESRTTSGVPFLSRIPILGMLFGVHRKREDTVNGLVAITPVVLDHPDRDSRRLIDAALEKFNRWKGKN